jgi:hypothetical protein
VFTKEWFINMQTFVHQHRAQLAALVAACCLFAALPLRAQELPFLVPAPAEQKLEELETIVIHGGLATPQMWKVSKGGHVMWVLGDAPAPPGTQWRFDQVEARLAESQLLLYPGRVDVDVGFFKVMGLLTQTPLAYKAVTKNPGDKTLKDVLPPDVYERWRVLKTAYAPRDNDIEKFRPSFAMEKLEEMIVAKHGEKSTSAAQPDAPRQGPWLRPLVDKAAKQHKVKVRNSPEVELKVVLKNVRGMLKFVGDFSAVDANCVTQNLEYLERRIEYLKQSVAGPIHEKPPVAINLSAADFRGPGCNDWAPLLEKLKSGEIPDTAGILKTMDEMGRRVLVSNQQLDAEWIAAAEAALAKNKSTFAVLQLHQLKDPDGHIAKLRELGYEVEEPDSVVK